MKLKYRPVLIMLLVITFLLMWCTTTKCSDKLNDAIRTYVECTRDWNLNDPNDAISVLTSCADPMVKIYYKYENCDCSENKLLRKYLSCFADIEISHADTLYDIAIPLLDCAIDLTKWYHTIIINKYPTDIS